MRKPEDQVGYIDPKSIDLDLAFEMTKGWCFDPPEKMSLENTDFPKVIDFDEFAEIKAPEGYKIIPPRDRHITIHTTCFDRALVWNSTHVFCELRFYTAELRWADPKRENYRITENPATKRDVGGVISGWYRTDLRRPTLEEDLKYGQGDWSGFEVGDMIHRWSSARNAVDCARRVIELRFRNHGKITVIDDTDELNEEEENGRE